MSYLRKLTGWGWIELVFCMFVIVIDWQAVSTDGLWLTLLIVVTSAGSAIYDEIVYLYSLPVNHPDQPCSDKQILGTMLRSGLAVGMCLAPIFRAEFLVQLFAVLVLCIAAYALYCSIRLHDFTSGDVKFEG